MFQSQEATELNQRYQAGERNFRNLQLRRLDLRGIDLKNADLRGADLSYANLREVDLSGVNLREAYLNEADLTGANLQGANLEKASLIKTYLIKANCQNANFEQAYLTNFFGTKCDFRGANFRGAYLNGAILTGANFYNAQYDETTHFDRLFNPQEVGMKRIQLPEKQQVDQVNKLAKTIEKTDVITVEKLLEIFNHIGDISHRYLGKKMTDKYWESSRPQGEWLEQFNLNESGEMTFTSDIHDPLTPTQLEAVRQWLKSYFKACSQVFPGLAQTMDRQKLGLIFTSLKQNKPTTSYEIGSRNQTEKKIPSFLTA